MIESPQTHQKKTYGVCELTGKTIPKARPWTRLVEAQAQLGRDGALRSAV